MIIPEGTGMTLGGLLAIAGLLLTLAGLLIRAYNLGKSHGKLRQDLNGVAAREKDKREANELRITNLEKAVLLVSKNDPEMRRIVEILTQQPKEKPQP